jgi:hypothetical protein
MDAIDKAVQVAAKATDIYERSNGDILTQPLLREFFCIAMQAYVKTRMNARMRELLTKEGIEPDPDLL